MEKFISEFYISVSVTICDIQQRPLSTMILKVEPMPEPCIILRVMGWNAEKPSISCFADLTTISLKNAIIQFNIEGGMSKALRMSYHIKCL